MRWQAPRAHAGMQRPLTHRIRHRTLRYESTRVRTPGRPGANRRRIPHRSLRPPDSRSRNACSAYRLSGLSGMVYYTPIPCLTQAERRASGHPSRSDSLPIGNQHVALLSKSKQTRIMLEKRTISRPGTTQIPPFKLTRSPAFVSVRCTLLPSASAPRSFSPGYAGTTTRPARRAPRLIPGNGNSPMTKSLNKSLAVLSL